MLIESAREKGTIGVGFSGGKDSTVALDLVRRVDPDAPAAFFDSGLEYPETYEIVAHHRVETIYPQWSLPQMLRHGGYWGAEAIDPDARFDFFAFLIGEPSARWVATRGIEVLALGLRGAESSGRGISARSRGPLFYARTEGLWRLCPLAHWTTDDVWAYLAGRGLRYHPAYDRMVEAGIPRDRQRVSTLLGLSAANSGRLAFLRATYPDLFRRLCAEFPMIARWT
jgi:phosphoadenosine phosphosulfate reductase